MNEDSVKLDFWIIYLYQTVYISSCLIVGHQEEPKQFLQSCSKPFSLPIEKNIFTGSIETVESCDGIKLSMEKEWGGAETWKEIRFVSYKRVEVGQPSVLGKMYNTGVKQSSYDSNWQILPLAPKISFLSAENLFNPHLYSWHRFVLKNTTTYAFFAKLLLTEQTPVTVILKEACVKIFDYLKKETWQRLQQ